MSRIILPWDRMIPRPGEKASFLGQTGSGKTTLSLMMAGEYYSRHQIHVLDIKHDPAWNKLAGVRVKKLAMLPRYGFPKYPLVIWRPTGMDAHDTEQIDSYFEWIYQRGNTLLIVDEVSQAVGGPTNYGPGFNDLITRGRVKNVTCFLGTQRPVLVPRIVFSESKKFFVFYLVDKRDRSTVAGFSNVAVEKEVPDRHGFWYVDTANREAEYFSSAR